MIPRTIEPGSRPVLCIHGKPIGEHCLCREEMPSTPEPAAMTIAGIIEREVAKIATSNHYITSADTRAACLAVAKSVVEECAKVYERRNNGPGPCSDEIRSLATLEPREGGTMSGECPNTPTWAFRQGHIIIGEIRWSTDGKSVMVNRCIRCGQEERAGD